MIIAIVTHYSLYINNYAYLSFVCFLLKFNRLLSAFERQHNEVVPSGSGGPNPPSTACDSSSGQQDDHGPRHGVWCPNRELLQRTH